MKSLKRFAVIGVMTLCCLPLAAQEINPKRALDNYIMLCRGCHLPDASGVPGSVPSIKDFAGHFLRVEGGREFLVQVPGSANSALNDEQLTELLNWLLLEFSKDQLPPDYRLFSVEEVSRLRKEPLVEVVNTRKNLVDAIAELGFEDPQNQ